MIHSITSGSPHSFTKHTTPGGHTGFAAGTRDPRTRGDFRFSSLDCDDLEEPARLLHFQFHARGGSLGCDLGTEIRPIGTAD